MTTIMSIRAPKMLGAIYWTVWVFVTVQTYSVLGYFMKC